MIFGKKQNYVEFKDEPKALKKPIKNKVKDLIIWSSKGNLLFVVLILLLFVGLIAMQYRMNNMLVEANKLDAEIQDLRVKSIIKSNQLMDYNKRSLMLKKIKDNNLGLEELTEPPREIIIED